MELPTFEVGRLLGTNDSYRGIRTRLQVLILILAALLLALIILHGSLRTTVVLLIALMATVYMYILVTRLGRELDTSHENRSWAQDQEAIVVEEKTQIDRPEHLQHVRRRFLVKQGQRMVSISTSDIAWFSADGKLCFLKTRDNRRFIVDYTLEELGSMLNPMDFFRVNRSYLIHASAVQSIEPYFGGKLILQVLPSPEVEDILVSKERAREFKKWMGK